MDILTQGLLGGVMAQAVANKDEKKLATLSGVAAGLLADADVLIRSSSDPLLAIEYHRHFTHSLFFVPIGAAIAMALLWPFMRQRLSLSRLYLFCFAGYALSGVLDACTSYGTLLLWPLSDERIAFNIISIVDPVFTLALLLSVLAGLWLGQRRLALCGIAFCVVYLGFGKLQEQRASLLVEYLAQQRGHEINKLVVKPTLGNLLLWRSTYRDDERIYIDALRLGLFSEAMVYQGETVPLFNVNKDLAFLEKDSVVFNDIERFTRFSDGYVALDRDDFSILGDMRYSMLPISAKPLWGIVIDEDKPNQHVEYRFFRKMDDESRQAFLNMLKGKEVQLGEQVKDGNPFQLPGKGI